MDYSTKSGKSAAKKTPPKTSSKCDKQIIIYVPYLSEVPEDSKRVILLKTLIYQFLYSFYEGTQEVRYGAVTDERFFRGYLTLFKTLFPDKLREQDLNETLKSSNCTVKFLRCREIFTFVKTMDRLDCSLGKFMNWFDRFMLWRDDRTCLVVFGMAFMNIGRYPDSQYFREYQMLFAETLCEILGIRFDEKLFGNICISLGSALRAHFAFEANFEFRRQIINLVMNFDNHQSDLGIVFNHVLRAFYFGSLHHKIQFDNYMLVLNEEFTNCRITDENHDDSIFIDIVYFLIKHKDDYPIMKLLLRPEEHEPDNENHLKHYYTATQYFIKRLNPKLEKYSILNGEPTKGDLNELLNQYLGFKVLQMTLTNKSEASNNPTQRLKTAMLMTELQKSRANGGSEGFDMLIKQLKFNRD